MNIFVYYTFGETKGIGKFSMLLKILQKSIFFKLISTDAFTEYKLYN